MLSSPPLAKAVPQLNTTREFPSVSEAVVPPLLSSPSTKAPNRMSRLVDHIYTTLGLDVNYVITCATIPGNGREIDGLNDKPELAHRIVLVNLLRLLGVIKTKMASRQIITRPPRIIDASDEWGPCDDKSGRIVVSSILLI